MLACLTFNYAPEFSDNLWFSDSFTKTIFQFTTYRLIHIISIRFSDIMQSSEALIT